MKEAVKCLMVAAVLCFFGCDAEQCAPCKVECQRYEDDGLNKIRKYVVDCLPPKSRDVHVMYNPGCFLGGAHTFVRCRIEEDDLKAFIADRGLRFRFDSTQENANKECKEEIAKTWPNEKGDGLLGFIPENKESWLNTCSDVDEYWSYNFIYTDNGGYRMFYDVKRHLFYADWSSN